MMKKCKSVFLTDIFKSMVVSKGEKLYTKLMYSVLYFIWHIFFYNLFPKLKLKRRYYAYLSIFALY